MTENLPWNQRSYRRILVDMHIPDWDERFLIRYDPTEAAHLAAKAGAEAVMIYFQSHVGLCYWPTASGRQHAAMEGRDLMAETLRAFGEQDLPVCAYYSVNFNNWAVLQHPDWALKPAVPSLIGGGLLTRERYGLCCFNHPEYREFVRNQTEEIVKGYDIDAMFFDMIWWMGVCLCDHCQALYLKETGEAIPETVNWFDPAWCRFQAARENWLTEFATSLRATVQRIKPELQVYHNFALGMVNWTRGVSFNSAAAHDFLGGDFYGGRDEQLVISRLMLNLSKTRPTEFMTTVAANLAEHEQLKSSDELDIQTLAAAANASAFLMIAAVDPDGRLNPVTYERIRASFEKLAPYEPYLGGDSVEDIGIYFSSESKMSFAENGRDLRDLPTLGPTEYPHFHAVMGACRALQRAHLPFGVITSKQLSDLSRYKVIVLPNVLRMSPEEAETFRGYVKQGGRLYASRLTSLTQTSGARLDDFMLGDVFGCRFDHEEEGQIIYLKPSGTLAEAIAPQAYISYWLQQKNYAGAVRVMQTKGDILATLTLPYGYPDTGSLDAKNWASIHSSPPWEDLENPALLHNDFGKGRAVYSVADIESGDSGTQESLFVHLIKMLLEEPPTFEADAHPSVWVTAFDQSDKDRMVVSLLNYQQEFPVIPLKTLHLHLKPPARRRFITLKTVPSKESIPFQLDDEGNLSADINDLGEFAMLSAEYGA